MEEQLISFETAKLAKEKGFNEECYLTYGKILKEYCIFKSDYSETNSEVNKYTYSAPTQSLLQKWLREKHKIHIELQCDSNYYKYFILIYYKTNCVFNLDDSLIYEEALEIGLQEALKLIE